MPPKIQEVKSVKGGLSWGLQSITSITLKDVLNGISLAALFLMLYAGLYLCIGKPFLPSGPAWAIMIIWAGAVICSFLAERVYIPGAVGMICSGLFLRNVATGILIRGLKASWSKQIRAAALSIIFLRSGLEIELGIFKVLGWRPVKLLFVPGLVEAFFDGGLMIKIFKMPPTFAFATGFILKAIGPALVIQAMFEVQQRRLGIRKAIPATVVAAASFDDMVAITGYTIFINLAVQGEGDRGWAIAHGPLSVVFGILAGLLAAVFCSITVLWNNKFKRTFMLFFTALTMKYFFDHFDFTSGGALGSLTLGLVVKELWKRGWPPHLSIDKGTEAAQQVERHVRWVWRFLMMPLLFGLIGTSVNFSSLAKGTIPKSVGIVFAGLATRMFITFCTMFGCGLTLLEQVFFAIAWSPKATVQAALAGLPNDLVNAAYKRGTPMWNEYHVYAQDTLAICVFAIIICGTFGMVAIRWFSPLLLERADDAGDDNVHRPMFSAATVKSHDANGNAASSMPPAAAITQQPISEAELVPIGGMPSIGPEISKGPSPGRLGSVQESQVPSMGFSGTGLMIPGEQKDAVDLRDRIRAQSNAVATHLDHIEEVAMGIQQPHDPEQGQAGTALDTARADQLITAVRELRQALLDEPDPASDTMEMGSSEFMRASTYQSRLRHRTPSASGHQSPTGSPRASISRT